jgi:phenylalanyl-tRNA synthetase beta chain
LKVSLNWLKEYVNLEGLSSKEIIDKLTLSGLEVEDYIDQAVVYKNFVVGLVTSKEKHPNADKLSLCMVNTGSNEFQVICGAPNVESGQKIMFAPVGSVIPSNNLELKKIKIRGVESSGMICSEYELALGDDKDGIMILDDKKKEGTPLTDALSLNDVIMEIAVTPNRPDALSHVGIARDLAAIFNRELKYPDITNSESKETADQAASVKVIDNVNCPRYSSVIINNVEIKESPGWLKSRLKSVGLRPINNVVDVTNFVMYELGQPLHAFDLKKLAGNKIIVKSTTDEISFTTLDSKQRKLPAGTLMICDGKSEVAVAGVMGGENSEVTASTKNILIESAYFNPVSIRRTSRALNLSTDSSYRFERGIDPNNTDFAAKRAAQLIVETAGGEILSGIIDIYPQKINNKEVRLRYQRIKKLLGYEIEPEKVKSILMKLGITILLDSEDELRLSVPAGRPDIEREADVIEEIARIYGYDKIPDVSKITISLNKKIDESEFVNNIRVLSTSLGLFEMLNNPLQSNQMSALTGNPIGLLNPSNVEMSFLRTSLIPGALSVIADNINNGQKDLALFEIGNVFNKKTGEEIRSFDDFTEEKRLIFTVSGRDNIKGWNISERNHDFFTLKGLVESFIMKFSLDNGLNDSYYHSHNSIYAFHFSKNFNEKRIGNGGIIRNDVLKQFDISQDVFCFEFNLDLLRKLKIRRKLHAEPVKYPKVIRDCAFIFDSRIEYSRIIEFIKAHASALLESVKLFDLFESESLGINKKSMAFSLEYQAEDRTLTEEEVEKEFQKLISLIEKEFKAKLRGK